MYVNLQSGAHHLFISNPRFLKHLEVARSDVASLVIIEER